MVISPGSGIGIQTWVGLVGTRTPCMPQRLVSNRIISQRSAFVFDFHLAWFAHGLPDPECTGRVGANTILYDAFI